MMTTMGGKRHGLCQYPEYRVWAQMIQRCTNTGSDSYCRYGARGISVCSRWRDSFLDFLADMGRRPEGHTLERSNNDGNYEPGNCRWATRKEQASNRRGNKYFFIVGGVRRTVKECSRLTGLDEETIRWRKRQGLSDTEVLSPEKFVR